MRPSWRFGRGWKAPPVVLEGSGGPPGGLVGPSGGPGGPP